MEHISNLFGQYRMPHKRKLSERGELIEFFAKELQRPPKLVAIRLSHYSLSDLYALKSTFYDRLARNGYITAIKYLWAISRTKVIPNDIHSKAS